MSLEIVLPHCCNLLEFYSKCSILQILLQNYINRRKKRYITHGKCCFHFIFELFCATKQSIKEGSPRTTSVRNLIHISSMTVLSASLHAHRLMRKHWIHSPKTRRKQTIKHWIPNQPKRKPTGLWFYYSNKESGLGFRLLRFGFPWWARR